MHGAGDGRPPLSAILPQGAGGLLPYGDPLGAALLELAEEYETLR